MGAIYTILWLAVVAALGCQRTAEEPPPGKASAAAPAAYAKDIAQVCDVVSLSGADKVPEGDRVLPVAQYLGSHIETQQAREFLARIQPLVGAAKADALDAEAKKVGLAGCALSAEWRKVP